MTRQLEAAVLVLAITAPCAFGQVADRERIINVDELREAMTKAAEPMARRIRSTTLDERFVSVAEALARMTSTRSGSSKPSPCSSRRSAPSRRAGPSWRIP